MEAVYIWGGWALLVIGILGCFIPVLPGPPLAYCALVLAFVANGYAEPSMQTMIVACIATVLVTVLDYVVPAIGARKFHCSKLGTWGCFVGTVVGLFFVPIGVILGPFIGALVGELLSGKSTESAFKGATGAFLGYLAGIILKLACCGYLAWVYWNAI